MGYRGRPKVKRSSDVQNNFFSSDADVGIRLQAWPSLYSTKLTLYSKCCLPSMLEFSSIKTLVTLNLKTIQGYEKYMLEYIKMNITDPYKTLIINYNIVA